MEDKRMIRRFINTDEYIDYVLNKYSQYPIGGQMSKAWIGCDLDGTLAKYDSWKGVNHIGEPVPLMVQRIKDHIKKGDTIKIMTARFHEGKEAIDAIQDWTEKHIGLRLEVTATKDYAMRFLYDDRAITVEPNTGIILTRNVF